MTNYKWQMASDKQSLIDMCDLDVFAGYLDFEGIVISYKSSHTLDKTAPLGVAGFPSRRMLGL